MEQLFFCVELFVFVGLPVRALTHAAPDEALGIEPPVGGDKDISVLHFQNLKLVGRSPLHANLVEASIPRHGNDRSVHRHRVIEIGRRRMRIHGVIDEVISVEFNLDHQTEILGKLAVAPGGFWRIGSVDSTWWLRTIDCATTTAATRTPVIDDQDGDQPAGRAR